jgi:hypothetical protein
LILKGYRVVNRRFLNKLYYDVEKKERPSDSDGGEGC